MLVLTCWWGWCLVGLSACADHLLSWDCRPGAGGPWRGGWGRLYLENYTVDASIFVAKLVRAHGGCLGTRSR